MWLHCLELLLIFLLPTTIEHTLNFTCRSPPLALVGWARCESSDRFWNNSVFNSAQTFLFFALVTWDKEIYHVKRHKTELSRHAERGVPCACFQTCVFQREDQIHCVRIQSNYRNGSDFPHTCTTRPVALKTSSRKGALWGRSGLYIFFIIIIIISWQPLSGAGARPRFYCHFSPPSAPPSPTIPS